MFPEQRVRIRDKRYLIPDVCVLLGERPREPVFTSPPLLWIEILSPEDQPERVAQKVREVLAFGVPYVCVIDPETLESDVHTASGCRKLEDGILRIEGTPIEVPLHALDEDCPVRPRHNLTMGQMPHTGLGNYNIIAFVSIVDVERAKEFYRDVLGLKLVSEEPPFALVFEAHGIMLRLAISKDLPPTRGTVLGWQVPDITAAVKDLERAGVRFERYEFVKQDDLGIWTTPSGAKVAWFKDPDGNILSLSEHPEWKQ